MKSNGFASSATNTSRHVSGAAKHAFRNSWRILGRSAATSSRFASNGRIDPTGQRRELAAAFADVRRMLAAS